jgi:hypothetical protein
VIMNPSEGLFRHESRWPFVHRPQTSW